MDVANIEDIRKIGGSGPVIETMDRLVRDRAIEQYRREIHTIAHALLAMDMTISAETRLRGERLMAIVSEIVSANEREVGNNAVRAFTRDALDAMTRKDGNP